LTEHAFAAPGRLLDPEVLRRITPEGGNDALQGSNLKLLTQLVDLGVFQRLAEAGQLRGRGAVYLGVDLLSDLNGALFAELAAANVEIGFYRRELQRSYVVLLVTLAQAKEREGRAGRKPEYPAPDRLPTARGEPLAQESLSSDLANAGRESRTAQGRPSEFRAAVREAARELSRRIESAQERVRDRATAAHLADLRQELGTIP
jgi:hypothetical protein